MPHNITDSDAFTDPATRPADGDLINAATVAPHYQTLANRSRFLANQLGGITGAGEWTYRSIKTRTFLVPLWPSFGAWSVHTDWTASAGSPVQAGISLIAPSPGDVQFVPLNPYIKDDWTIDTIRLLCKPAAVVASPNRLQLQLWGVTPNFGTPAAPTPAAIGTATEDDGTTNVQAIQAAYGPAPVVVTDGMNVAKNYFLKLTAGSTDDVAYALQLTCGVPGPRDI